eukprot:4388654-Karenia_brevis.AAC.1
MPNLDVIFQDDPQQLTSPLDWLPTTCVFETLQFGVGSGSSVVSCTPQTKVAYFRGLGYSEKVSWFLHLLFTFTLCQPCDEPPLSFWSLI